MKRIFEPKGLSVCVCRAEMKRIFRPESLPMGRLCVGRAEMKRIFRPESLPDASSLCVQG
jgi:hypothetical protein